MFHRSFQRIDAKTAFVPVAVSGSTAINGVVIDRLNYQGASLALALGATTGTPTGTQLAVKIQHDDAIGMGTVTDYVTVGTFGSASANFTSGDAIQKEINLEGAKRYVRVVVTPTFTAGTGPTVLTAGVLALEDATAEPVPSIASPVGVIALP